LTRGAKLTTLVVIAVRNLRPSKRIFPLVVIVLIASLLWTTVVHACSDLSAMQTIFKAPCEHSGSRDEPASKAEKDNCDAVRYGMLSTQASPSQTELLKLHSIPLDYAFFVISALPDNLPLLWRSDGPPNLRLGVSPLLSHVVLRI